MVRKSANTHVMALICASLLLLACISVLPAGAEENVQRGETQYIAALGDPNARSGDNAQDWGLWAVDPGPRGVQISDLPQLAASGGVTDSGWKFDPSAWWLEEHGLVMEAPTFPLAAGKYVVTGGRETTSVLSVEAPDSNGKQAWSLADGANIHDVTHLRCRAALYTARNATQACMPDRATASAFPMGPGISMPSVTGCNKREYQVLIVLGRIVEG
ncbi:MAG: hypothetical protein KDJ66_14385 [Nitratireductor sp.]|nr:hypothetical protein [Nitratireductor sp.]